MRSVCFYSSYFTGEIIPYYIKIYLEELSRHFSDIIFLTNEKTLTLSELNYLDRNNIQLRRYKNEGYDFGMWYKVFDEFNVKQYDRIGLINDSCILYRTLDSFFEWADSGNFDYCGMVASGKISYHIQSYFAIINKNAITEVKNFFSTAGIKTSYKEVIFQYEIALSKQLQQKGFTLGGYYDYKNETKKNPSFLLAPQLIMNKCPVIKKKIITRKYYPGDYLTWFRNDFNIDERYYIDLIKKQNGDLILDFEQLINEPGFIRNRSEIRWYNIFKKIYQRVHNIKLLRFIFHQLILIKRKLKIEI